MRCATMPGVRRHPVVGQTVPGREFQHGDVGRKEVERARQRRHARPVAADHQQARRRCIGARGDRARKIGDDQPFGAVGDTRERQRAAGDQRSGGRFRHHRASAAVDVEVAQPAEQRRVELGRDCDFPGHPGEQVAVGHLHQPLELVDFDFGQVRDRCVGKAAHDQVHLAHAAVPGAEQNLAATHVQSIARSCAAGHRCSNAKSPDVPGAGYIAGRIRLSGAECSLPAISGV